MTPALPVDPADHRPHPASLPGPGHPGHREVHDLATLDAVMSQHRSLAGWRLQGVDLSAHAEALRGVEVAGLAVLGGVVPEAVAADLRARGAILIPSPSNCPVDPFRGALYTAQDLYAGLAERGYDATVDARAYHWSREGVLQHDAYVTLLRAIHDDSMSDALTDALHDRPVVGVMGGHALPRGASDYRDAARLGHRLAASGHVVITGGGPGAMEAANLGALAESAEALDAAVDRVGAVPGFRPSIEDWAKSGFEARAALTVARDPAALTSVGVPTWFYGHEPPNVFCDGIAKYFSNALREEILLATASAGIVVLPGAAGTVQEIFQAVTPLFYAAEDSVLPPLVLVGSEHWVDTVPVWPALRALAQGRLMGEAIHLVETVDEATDLLLSA